MSPRSIFCILVLTMTASWCLPASRADRLDAQTWYDTLGFPNARDLPYVRAATGRWSQSGNQPPRNRFAEGFLVGETPDSFTVFICSVSDFEQRFNSEPYAPLTTVRFIRKTTGPAHEQVYFEVLDFAKVASQTLDRVRNQTFRREDGGLFGGRPVTHRARIFSFARACQQKGQAETAAELMNFAANIPDEVTEKVEPWLLREMLQREIGDAVLVEAEADFEKASNSWAELLKPYEYFESRFPASPKVAYAKEAATLLRQMIAEEAAHQPKPLEQMSVAEQAAENIYQLCNLIAHLWIMHSHYPLDARTRTGAEIITPVHRLVDLGDAAVPQLIEALDDQRFTRALEPTFHGWEPAKAMRVSDVVRRILDHISGRSFYARKSSDGKLTAETVRQKAEAWWAERQTKGEKQQLLEAIVLGGDAGSAAARKLAEKYPEAAMDAIEAAIAATESEGRRSEFVEIAGGLPAEMPVAFLKSQLASGHGLLSQVKAARALFARGQPEAVPAMIEAWRRVQPRLHEKDTDIYFEVGGLITFLARSGSAEAINALTNESRKAPVDVRLALAQAFVRSKNLGLGASGRTVHFDSTAPMLPVEEPAAAIERLLVSALNDSEARVGMNGNYDDVSYKDPRVCDVAALALSRRWPEKYQFKWTADAVECDVQIARIRGRFQWENGVPATSPSGR